MPRPPLDADKDFLLGADPEMGFTDESGLVTAADLIRDANYRRRFGLDGCGRVAELRPPPASEPEEVVQNLRRSMLRQRRSLDNVEWRAGSFVGDQEPIGGHIHFGTSRFHRNTGAPRVTIETCVRALDTFMAPSLALLEDAVQARERRRRYGNLGDFRVNDHGFEYRAPASWLTSPYIALGVLALAKTVVWEVLHHGMRGRHVVHGSPRWVRVRDLDAAALRRDVASHWRRVQACELYPRYADEIGLIERLVRERRTWFPAQSLKEAWGLAEPGPPEAAQADPLPQVSLEAIWCGLPYTRRIPSTMHSIIDIHVHPDGRQTEHFREMAPDDPARVTRYTPTAYGQALTVNAQGVVTGPYVPPPPPEPATILAWTNTLTPPDQALTIEASTPPSRPAGRAQATEDAVTRSMRRLLTGSLPTLERQSEPTQSAGGAVT